MKIIFFGTPLLAVPVLRKLKEQHDILTVVTQPDSPVGRKRILTPSPIAEFAEKNGLKIIKPEKLDADFIAYLTSLQADLFVTFAYGKIFKDEILTVTKMGGINVHPSLLPKFRGASPIQSAILNGEKKSGITIQKIALKVDCGKIIVSEKFEITEEDDAVSIEKLVAEKAVPLVEKALTLLEQNSNVGQEQDNEKASYCHIIKKEDGIINWQDSNISILNKIRAYIKWPIASTFLNTKRLNIYKAKISSLPPPSNVKLFPGTIICADKKRGIHVLCGEGTLEIEVLQIAGKNKLNAAEFINGYQGLDGKILKKNVGEVS